MILFEDGENKEGMRRSGFSFDRPFWNGLQSFDYVLFVDGKEGF